MVIELVYVTVVYKCECVAARPVRPPRTSRLVYSNTLCDYHAQKEKQAQEQKVTMRQEQEKQAMRYIVDGHPMTIYKNGMYWNGRGNKNGKQITKYFGKEDPRPSLEEALT